LDPALGGAGCLESSAVELADGRVLAVWTTFGAVGFGPQICSGFAATVNDFLTVPNSVSAQTVLIETDGPASSCVQRIGADLFLGVQIEPAAPAIYDPSIDPADPPGYGVFIYRSVDEEATWQNHGIIPTGASFGSWPAGSPGQWCQQGEIYVSGGRWIVTHQAFTVFLGMDSGVGGISTSDDGGLTWTLRLAYGTAGDEGGNRRQLTQWSDGKLYVFMDDDSGAGMMSSADNGTTWVPYQTITAGGVDSPFVQYGVASTGGGSWNTGQSGSSHIMFHQDALAHVKAYEATVAEPLTTCTFCVPVGVEEWTEIRDWDNGGAGFTLTSGAIAQPFGSRIGFIGGAFLLEIPTPVIPYLIFDFHDCYSFDFLTGTPFLNGGAIQISAGSVSITVTITDPRDPGNPIITVLNPGDPILYLTLSGFGCDSFDILVDVDPGVTDPIDHYAFTWDFLNECCGGPVVVTDQIDCGPYNCGGG